MLDNHRLAVMVSVDIPAHIPPVKILWVMAALFGYS
jgi:hypothetical protein